MKLAVLSDIHGNVWALRAVLADAGRRSVDRFVNLGDNFYGPLKPRETFDLLQAIPAVSVQGNQDRLLYQAVLSQIAANPTLAYVLRDLGPQPLESLFSLPKTDIISAQVFLCHGSPRSDSAYLLEDISLGYPVVKPESAILPELSGLQLPVICCGHTHLPRLVVLSGGCLLLNPGSVGLPAYDDDAPNFHVMQNYSPHASYALLEQVADGWQVDLIKVPYDFSPAVEQALSLGRHDWAHWLATGRVAP